jgi:hypothetical protein
MFGRHVRGAALGPARRRRRRPLGLQALTHCAGRTDSGPVDRVPVRSPSVGRAAAGSAACELGWLELVKYRIGRYFIRRVP